MKFVIKVLVCVGVVVSVGCQSAKPKVSLGHNMAVTMAHLNRGGDVNARDDHGWTLLMGSTIHNKPKITELLLKAGANPDLTDSIKRSPIFWVKGPEVTELLINYGANLDLVDVTGKTPLAIAQNKLKIYKGQKGAIWPKLVGRMQEVVDLLSGNGTTIKWLRYAQRGQLEKLKMAIVNGVVLTDVDAKGNTALHLAADNSHDAVVGYLISKKLPLNIKNAKGKTAFELVSKKKNKTAKVLSCAINSNCKSVSGFEKKLAQACSKNTSRKQCLQATRKDIHGVFMTADISERMSFFTFNLACKKFSYKKCKLFIKQYSDSSFVFKAELALERFRPKGEALFSKYCNNNGKIKNCKKFVMNHPGLIKKNKVDNALMFLSQRCRLKENGWFYKGDQCKAGLAHGIGEAVNISKNLSFKGRFVSGQRIKGEILYDGQPMFDGKLLGGRPNGVGICFYKNEPEECKFYKGKRVDGIYKQRLANIDQQEKMDAKLAEMKRIQQQQSDQISQMQNRAQTAAQNQQQGRTVGQEIGDYAMKKAGEKVMDKLFDKLF